MSITPIFIRRQEYLLNTPILPRYNLFLLIGFFCMLFIFWASTWGEAGGTMDFPHPILSILVFGLMVCEVLFLFLLPKGKLENQGDALVIHWRGYLPLFFRKETVPIQEIRDIYISGDLSWTKPFFAYRRYVSQRGHSDKLYSIMIRRKSRTSIEFIGVSPADTNRILLELKGLKIPVLGGY